MILYILTGQQRRKKAVIPNKGILTGQQRRKKAVIPNKGRTKTIKIVVVQDLNVLQCGLARKMMGES